MTDDDEPIETPSHHATQNVSVEPSQSVQAFALTVLSGPDAGHRFASTGSTLTLGTHRSVGAVLTDPTVSRFHAEIDVASGRPRIRDLESRNGTSVDGVAVELAFLRDAATLSVGRTLLRFDVGHARIDVPASRSDAFALLRGRSLAMRRVFEILARTAPTDATMLLLGETGTGKEAVAESVHRESRRAKKPFVVVDCGAIPAGLLESELFGHEKGAFTNASGTRHGILETANGGTVFLDEIGELGADLQPKLLRALEKREIRRVGANDYQPIDVRVIAATHRDLRAEVNARRFRSDLYYRLAVVEVRLPPLRERREDIPLLVDHFLEAQTADVEAASEGALRYVRSAAFAASVASHQWPGNVRELRNYLERTLALFGLPDTPTTPTQDADAELPLKEARDACVRRFEREYLESILARHDGNVTAAARAAGVDRAHFYRLLWRYDLRERT